MNHLLDLSFHQLEVAMYAFVYEEMGKMANVMRFVVGYCNTRLSSLIYLCHTCSMNRKTILQYMDELTIDMIYKGLANCTFVVIINELILW